MDLVRPNAGRPRRHAVMIPAWWSRAALWPLPEALDALKAGLSRDPYGNLALALDAFERRLVAARPSLAGNVIRLAAKRLVLHRPVVGRLRIIAEGNYWRPADIEAGVECVTIPEIYWLALTAGKPATCVDIIAVEESGGAVHNLTGHVPALGEGYIRQQIIDGETVRLVADPLEWARLGGGGAPVGCVLPFESDFVAEVILRSARLICVDSAKTDRLEHAVTLQKMQRLLRPKLPPVTVRTEHGPRENQGYN